MAHYFKFTSELKKLNQEFVLAKFKIKTRQVLNCDYKLTNIIVINFQSVSFEKP